MKQLTIFVLTMLAMAGIFGCNTEKQFNGYIDKSVSKRDSPRIGRIAEKCSLLFPIIESDNVQYKYLPGQPYALPGQTQWVESDCSQAVRDALDEAARGVLSKGPKIIKIAIPVYKQVDTQQIINTTIKKSTADFVAAQGRANALQQQINAITSDLSRQTAETTKYKGEKRSWQGRALWTWGILLLLIIIRVCWKYISSHLP